MKFLCVAVAALIGLVTGCSTCASRSKPFHFALIGDTPYNDQQVTNHFPNMIRELNAAHLEFVVHDGDIKSGTSPCTDELLKQRLAQFQTIRHPLVYTPGDNEWTDCGRAGRDPLDALARVRELFTAGEESLGQRKIKLTRQSNHPEFAAYRENVRWTRGGITFATLHIVGSKNNYTNAEFAARNAANLAWLHEAFASARRERHRAVMLICQANPFPEIGSTNRVLPGFAPFVDALRRETLAFEGQVVLVHGDSHYFRIDKPLLGPSKRRIENFTRVETFGDPDVHWLLVTADEQEPNVFTFRPRIVEKNRVHAAR